MPARLAAMTTYRVLDEWQRMNRRRHLKRIVLALHDREGFNVFREVARLMRHDFVFKEDFFMFAHIFAGSSVRVLKRWLSALFFAPMSRA